MEGKPLERLERIARNLPAHDIKFGRTKSPYSDIYFAYGKGDFHWYGIWGVDQPTSIGMLMHPLPLQMTAEEVRVALARNAGMFLELCASKGLIRSGAKFGKKLK